MQVDLKTVFPTTVVMFLVLCRRIYSYRTYSALSSVVFTNIDPPQEDVHNEFYFGMCATRHKSLELHRKFTHEELKGNLLVGEWVELEEDPICIYIRARSSYGVSIRYHPMQFSICMCKVIYSYGGKTYTYWYYEWYIPIDISEGMSWDIFFYKKSYFNRMFVENWDKLLQHHMNSQKAESRL